MHFCNISESSHQIEQYYKAGVNMQVKVVSFLSLSFTTVES